VDFGALRLAGISEYAAVGFGRAGIVVITRMDIQDQRGQLPERRNASLPLFAGTLCLSMPILGHVAEAGELLQGILRRQRQSLKLRTTESTTLSV